MDRRCAVVLRISRSSREPGSACNLSSTYPPPGPSSICSAATTSSIRWYVGQCASLSPSDRGPDLKCENRPKPERALFEEADKFGIRCGFTFAILDDRCVIAALSFATDERRAGFARALLEHAQSLRLVATVFHEHAKRFWTIDRMVGGVVLSHREYQCLEGSARGKSAGEIGIILGRRANRGFSPGQRPCEAPCQLPASSDRAVDRIKISKMDRQPSINASGTAQDALA